MHHHERPLGPWDLGRWYRPLAVLSVLGWAVVMAVCMVPPNQKAAWFTGSALLVMAGVWYGCERRRFQGPRLAMVKRRQDEQTAASDARAQRLHIRSSG